MRSRYLVAYDISEARRLRRVFKIMNGFGDALQYSVFVCDLSQVEKWKLKDALVEAIHHHEDRVIFVNLGPSGGRGLEAFEYLGRQGAAPEERKAVIV
jgi:CRISPR-associated protein Cas2